MDWLFGTRYEKQGCWKDVGVSMIGLRTFGYSAGSLTKTFLDSQEIVGRDCKYHYDTMQNDPTI
jgi:hypothetical protein